MVDQFEDFVRQFKWRVAKTMPNIPHEYIVIGEHKDKRQTTEKMLKMISLYGQRKYFCNRPYQYLEVKAYKYWVVGDIINRAKI